eukprot:NODE_5769_length_678_cov_3.289348_g4880_i0.p4 GENE.NODE_5769_length_678_cov_3.289348_g4880_i0~~NODE_5769_length_678_cov_3.289348_g4880_i0.p4  ORF type:complete len:55 (+),score=6.40 NODE_5769_length_678_cov_3.289348_g4880_i0:247-411(+)
MTISFLPAKTYWEVSLDTLALRDTPMGPLRSSPATAHLHGHAFASMGIQLSWRQ